MANWYVRPDTSHNGTRNGTSYATAWGGWSAIVWGGAGVVGGDTLYICGAHSYAAAQGIGAHGGSSEATRCTISGGYAPDPGSITFSGASYIGSQRAWTTIRDLTITAASSNCIYTTAGATNCKYIDNTFIGTNSAAPLFALEAANGNNYSDLTFDGNTFTGTCLSGLRWLCAAAGAVSTLTRITITNNTFTALTVSEGAINMRAENDTSTSSIITDMILDDNVFEDVTYTCVRVGSDFTDFGLCKGIKIRDNVFKSSGNAGANGGAMAPHSWGHSSTAGFGANEISGNTIQGMRGVTGGINLFDSECIIQNNLIEDCTSTTIDANGILIDLGCANCTIRWNKINTCLGKAAVVNSGYAVMILEATNITVYGNIGTGNRNGVHIGAAGAGQSMSVFNNTFTDCIEYGIYANASADLTNCTVKNNIFTGTGYSVFDATATAWTGENNNVFYGFSTGTSNHSLGAQDQSADPGLRSDYMPMSSAVRTAGTYLGGGDFYGKEFGNTPTIGAVQYQSARSLTTRTVVAGSVASRELATRRVITV